METHSSVPNSYFIACAKRERVVEGVVKKAETGGFAPVTTRSILEIANFGREIGVINKGLEASGGLLVAISRCAYENRGVQPKPQG